MYPPERSHFQQPAPDVGWRRSHTDVDPLATSGLARLTQREWDVLVLLCQRQTDLEIAARLFISPRTVATHVSSILVKLGAANRREAAAISLCHGLT
ncbi:MAG: helix-turn-helix transcriptional regulator [Thermomicrobiales bacterium]